MAIGKAGSTTPQVTTPLPSGDTPKLSDGAIKKGAYDVQEVTDYTVAKIKAIIENLSDDDKAALIELENKKDKPRKSVVDLLQ